MLESESTQALFEGYYYNSDINLLSPMYPFTGNRMIEQSIQCTADTSKNII